MKALLLSEPNHMELVERPVPSIGPDEALIKVAAAAICHTDVSSIAGRNANVRMPLVLGHEFSGTVTECGPAVHYIKPGDRVAVPGILACFQCRNCWRGLTTLCLHYDELGARRDGGFQEYVAVPARVLIPIADGFSLESAALAEPAANAFSVVERAKIQPGEDVVIVGPGAIGLLVLQFARLRHPRSLILVGTRDERLAVGAKLGATHTVNVRRRDPVQAVREITGGKMADVVVQAAGALDAMHLAVSLRGEGCRVCIEGTLGSLDTLNVLADDFVVSALRIIGVRGWNQWDFVRALEAMQAGLIDPGAVITHRFPLTEWQAAFETSNVRKNESLRVLLVP